MVNAATLEDKLDSKFEKLVEICQETLEEVKKLSNIQGVKIAQHDKDIEKAAESRKEIYQSIGKINQELAALREIIRAAGGRAPTSPQNRRSTDQPSNAIEAWIGKKFYVAISIVIGSMLGAIGIEILKALLRRS